MKIKAITWQHRRDFTAIYECQFCGHIKSGSGYDDSYFHNSVIPDMKCEKCGKSTNFESYAEKPMVRTTRYPDWMEV
jgi:transcription elongation factor Elf1